MSEQTFLDEHGEEITYIDAPDVKTWTSKAPTRRGLYWFWEPDSDSVRLCRVQPKQGVTGEFEPYWVIEGAGYRTPPVGLWSAWQFLPAPPPRVIAAFRAGKVGMS